MSDTNHTPTFERLNFFPGFFTTADDWTAGETYHIEKRKLHNRALHTPGVVCGLTVTPGPSDRLQVMVEAGIALDRKGNLITLPANTAVPIQRPDTEKTYFITIEFCERDAQYEANVQDPDYSGFTRKQEAPRLRAWDENSCGALPNTQLVLAKVHLDASATVVCENDIDCTMVQKAGAADPAKAAMLQALKERQYHAYIYQSENRRRHNRGVHTAGVLNNVGCEFDVVAVGGLTLRIEPGAAYTAAGEEIYLPKPYPITLCPSESARLVYVGVKYHDPFATYLGDLNQPLPESYATALIEATESAPDNKTLIEVARIELAGGATEIQEANISQSAKPISASIGVAPSTLPPDQQTAVAQLMQLTREHFATLALRFPLPSTDDVRAAALQIQMSVPSVRPEQASVLLATLANVEQDVEHELAARYPPLVRKAEFHAYQAAVAALLEALRTHRPLLELINGGGQVALTALDLADVVLQPPTADAGPDQKCETLTHEADVDLDASGSTAAEGQTIVRYHWEDAIAMVSLRDIPDPMTQVTLAVGYHVLKLVVEDDAGLLSRPDTVTICVEKIGTPVAGHIDPNKAHRGATVEAVISGEYLQYVTDVTAYCNGRLDERVTVTVHSGSSPETLSVTIHVSELATFGPRALELNSPHGKATVPFTIVPHELPIILGIAPTWGLPGYLGPMPARIEGDHLQPAEQVALLQDGKPDPLITTIIRRATDEYLDVDLTVSADADFGRRRIAVTTPAGTTESSSAIYFTIVPGLLSVAIMALTLATAIIHFTLNFPDPLFIFNGVGYLLLLLCLYLPTQWLVPGLRPWIRWLLLVYTLITIIAWIAIGPGSPLAYITKAIEGVLVLLLFAESRRP